MATYYETLGVDPHADAYALRKAYRELARRHHPDVNPEGSSHESMAQINEAFRTLIDPDRRTEYDAMLRAGFGRIAEAKRYRNRAPIQVRIGHRLTGHRTPVYAIGFTPDSRQVVSVSFDNEVHWWDADSGESLESLRIESGVVSSMRVLGDGRILCGGSSDNHVSLFEVREYSASHIKTTPAQWTVCLDFSPEGRSVALGKVDHELTVLDAKTGQSRYTVHDHHGSVTALAWSPDGKYLASGSSDATVRLREAKTGRPLHTLSSIRGTVTALAFSGDGQYIAVASADLAVRVFSLADGSLKRTLFGHQKPIETLAFHGNGWLFASGGRDGMAGLWTAADGLGEVHLRASHKPISAVAFSTDGKKFVTAGQDRTVQLWSLTAKRS